MIIKPSPTTPLRRASQTLRFWSLLLLILGLSKAGWAQQSIGAVDTSYDYGRAIYHQSTDTYPRPWVHMERVMDMAPYPNGKQLVIADWQSSFHRGRDMGMLYRIDSNQNVDPTFQLDTSAIGPLTYIRAAVVLPSGKIAAMVRRSARENGNWNTYFRLLRLHPNGQLDTSFQEIELDELFDHLHQLEVLDDGRIAALLQYDTYQQSANYQWLHLYHPDGRIDTTIALYTGDVAHFQELTPGELTVYDLDRGFRVGDVIYKHMYQTDLQGQRDTTFPFPNLQDSEFTNTAGLLDILSLGGGKMLIGGRFTYVDSQRAVNLAVLHADGSIDPAASSALPDFTGGFSRVYGLQRQPGGKIIVTGRFDRAKVGGRDYNIMFRLNADLTLDTTFRQTFFEKDRNLIQPQVVNYEPSGLWHKPLFFLPNGDFYVRVEHAYSYKRLELVDKDGGLKNFVPAPGFSEVPDRGPIPTYNGKSYFLEYLLGTSLSAHHRPYYNGEPLRYINRLNEDGSVDTTFQFPDTLFRDIRPEGALAQQDGSLLTWGRFEFVSPYTSENYERETLLRILPDGSIDTNFMANYRQVDTANPGDPLSIHQHTQVIEQADGKLLFVGGQYDSWLGRMNPDGTRDTSFQNTEANFNSAADFKSAPDGGIIVAMYTNSYRQDSVQGHPVKSIFRLHADGQIDTSFHSSGEDEYFNGIAIQPNGKILVYGAFNQYEGHATQQVVRLQADGDIDSSFQFQSPRGGEVPLLKVDQSGHIWMLSHQDNADYQHIPVLLQKLTPTGAVDTSVSAYSASYEKTDVEDFAFAGNRKIWLRGGFDFVNQSPAHFVARIHSGGCSASRWKLRDSVAPGGSYAFNGRELTEPGVYYDTLQSQAGCDSIVRLELVRGTAVGQETVQRRQLRLYPQPAEGYVYLERTQAAPVRLQVFDIQGSMHHETLIQGRRHRLDVGHLPRGVYLIGLSDGGRMHRLMLR